MITRCLNVLLHKDTSNAVRSVSLSVRTRTNSWVRPRAVVRFGSTKRRTGLFKDIFTSSSTESVIVAENNIVWRDTGHDLMISANSSANPSESIRSASSRTRTSSASSVKEGELRKWSISRPGVAITTSGRVLKFASCDLRESPPRYCA